MIKLLLYLRDHSQKSDGSKIDFITHNIVFSIFLYIEYQISLKSDYFKVSFDVNRNRSHFDP